MKRINNVRSVIYPAVIALSILAVSCGGGNDKQGSKVSSITFTTEKKAGESMRLGIWMNSNDATGVWVDWNNNQTKDEGEEVTAPGSDSFEGTIGSQTITVYGNVTNFNGSVGKISNIDVSNNPGLESLTLTSNEIRKIDLSKNKGLQHLRISNNQLAELDLTRNPELKYLDCSSNKLTSLKIKETLNLSHIDCMDNELDDKAMIALFTGLPAYEGSGTADATVSYGEDRDKNVVSQTAVDLAKSKKWNIMKSTREGDISY